MKTRIIKIGLFLCTIGFLFPANTATAQTTINVTASGFTFTPSSITINVGDTVRWTNSGGNHNVNGTTLTFPSNPESFGNATGFGWTYSYVFNTAGTYDYRCDVHISVGMVGDITVLPPMGIDELGAFTIGSISSIYPIPAYEQVVIEISPELLLQNAPLIVIVYDLMGKEIARKQTVYDSIVRFDTEKWSNSIYIVHLQRDAQIIGTEKIIVR
ncbi:MAG: T9SS type A sorting domain-containing protein [Crocinitomicaceae bacterium]|nr:T9SS type A sorting domain-containing protein [Crocinitomicaceae bacterium]